MGINYYGYNEPPAEAPEWVDLYCPWCGSKEIAHKQMAFHSCACCGKSLMHDQEQVSLPEVEELALCADEALIWMIEAYCIPRKDLALGKRILQVSENRPQVRFQVAWFLAGQEETFPQALEILQQMARDGHYDAAALLYNSCFTEDLKNREQLKTFCELLILNHGDLTAADTLRTLMQGQ